MKNKQYKKAPLPFMGQKRNFLKHFKEALKDYNEDAVYVDLFGGSGLLSQTVKATYPKAKVVYNDFDGYSERLLKVEQTNELRRELYEIVKKEPCREKILGDLRDKILKTVKKHHEKNGVDFTTISTWLLFSMNYVKNFEELEKNAFYNMIAGKDYEVDGYLEGLEVVCLDYNILFEKYKNMQNVVFIADPPYLSTQSGNYKNYWKLKGHLEVLKVLKNTNYFYFTSNKSDIIELCDWIEENAKDANPLKDAKIKEIKLENHNCKYTDIMIHKKIN